MSQSHSRMANINENQKNGGLKISNANVSQEKSITTPYNGQEINKSKVSTGDSLHGRTLNIPNVPFVRTELINTGPNFHVRDQNENKSITKNRSPEMMLRTYQSPPQASFAHSFEHMNRFSNPDPSFNNNTLA